MKRLKIETLKKTFCSFTILCTLLLFGCTSDKETSLCNTKLNESNIYSTDSYQKFINSVDNLNRVYSGTDINTRGSFWNGAATSMADYVGYACGGSIGRWVGGSLGSLTGNPIAVYGGILIGGKIGPSICGSLASGIASMLVLDIVVQETEPITFRSNFAFSEFLDAAEDSIGYHHNKCMTLLHENRNKYGVGLNTDCMIIYDDIVGYYKSVGEYNPCFEDKNFKKAVLDEARTIVETAYKFRDGAITEAELSETYLDYLSTKLKYSEEDISLFQDYYSKVLINCGKLNEVQIRSYAAELNELIRLSDFPTSKKSKIASSSQFIINSALCWVK